MLLWEFCLWLGDSKLHIGDAGRGSPRTSDNHQPPSHNFFGLPLALTPLTKAQPSKCASNSRRAKSPAAATTSESTELHEADMECPQGQTYGKSITSAPPGEPPVTMAPASRVASAALTRHFLRCCLKLSLRPSFLPQRHWNWRLRCLVDVLRWRKTDRRSLKLGHLSCPHQCRCSPWAAAR